MEPTIPICFPELSDSIAQTTVQAYGENTLVQVSSKRMVHYQQTLIRLEVPGETRASVEIREEGLYFFILQQVCKGAYQRNIQ